jgi:NADH-quinone oxidoreductase subunit H
MSALVARLVAAGWGPPWLVALGAMVVLGSIVVFLFVLPVAGITTWVERRVMARMQSRVGPNRTGPIGFLQWLADGVKSVLKEDVIPAAADRRLFALAPYVVMTGFIGTFAALPFSSALVLADLNVGIVYVTAVTSLVVVGILMAGWSSNNKWALLGGIRSAAQIVSYEIPAGLAIFPAVLHAGTLSMQGLVAAQGAAPWHWLVFHDPFALVACGLLFTASLAEGNRTPFDLPEAESELVAGFATEYSGMRSLLFFFAEWGNLYVIGAITTTLYLGGWQIPWALPGHPVLKNALEVATFVGKACVVGILFPIWVRWTLPRIRVDQMMTMCWKYLVPIALVCLLGSAAWVVAFPEGLPAVRWALFGLFVLATAGFVRRVRFHIAQAHLARAHLSFNPLATARAPK